MRVSVPVTALCLSMLPLMAVLAGSQAGAATATPDAPPSATAPVATAAPTNDVPDAAAKHAKRTDCLKEARAKKLVGAAKTAYIKTCVASP